MAFARVTGHPRERLSGREQETRPALPRPCATVPCRPVGPGTTKGQRPTRRGRSARRWRGGRWPGALGPRLDRDQRGAVAGAMAPAIEAGAALSPVLAGPGNATRVSPAPAGRSPVDRQVRDQRKASARPGGGEAPATGGAGAGRGLLPLAGRVVTGCRKAGVMAPAGLRGAHARKNFLLSGSSSHAFDPFAAFGRGISGPVGVPFACRALAPRHRADYLSGLCTRNAR